MGVNDGLTTSSGNIGDSTSLNSVAVRWGFKFVVGKRATSKQVVFFWNGGFKELEPVRVLSSDIARREQSVHGFARSNQHL